MTSKRLVVLLGVAGLAFGILHFARRLPSRTPFFVSNTAALRQLPREDLLRMRDDILAAAAALPDTKVSAERFAGETAVAGGSLQAVGRNRVVEGRIEIISLPDGERVARLKNFRVTNAPELRLLLCKPASLSNDSQAVPAGSIDLGKLAGNAGDQNFPIPEDVNLDEIRSAAVWCDLFEMLFATAPVRGAGD